MLLPDTLIRRLQVRDKSALLPVLRVSGCVGWASDQVRRSTGHKALDVPRARRLIVDCTEELRHSVVSPQPDHERGPRAHPDARGPFYFAALVRDVATHLGHFAPRISTIRKGWQIHQLKH